MSINEPSVTVTDVADTVQRGYGTAAVVAFIGAFNNATTTIESYTSLEKAQDELKGDAATVSAVPAGAKGYHCLPYLFNQNNQSYGPVEVIIVNTTTSTTNNEVTTLNYELTNEKLASAYALLADEAFDILCFGDTITNAQAANLKTFRDTQYAAQKPFGIIAAFSISNANEAETFKGIFNTGGIYKAITTPIQIKGDANALSLEKSAAWHAAFTAGRQVNKSETGKVYEELIGVDSKSQYPTYWEDLLDNGLHTQKYRNRRLKIIECIRNWTPNGRDMKVERTKNYMIKKLSFEDVFGEDTVDITKSYVTGLFEYEKKLAKEAGLITDMTYDITYCSSKCVKANLELIIPDIVTQVKLNVSIELTPKGDE